MPAEDRRGAAMGAPGFGKLTHRFFARSRVEAEDAADRLLHRQVARGPDVGAPLGEEQIDFGRPAADALDLGEQRDSVLVVGGESGEVEPAVEDERPEELRRALLLFYGSMSSTERGWLLMWKTVVVESVQQ